MEAIDKDFLSYRVNDEVSADVAQQRLNHSIPRTYIRTGDTIIIVWNVKSPVRYKNDIWQHKILCTCMTMI